MRGSGYVSKMINTICSRADDYKKGLKKAVAVAAIIAAGGTALLASTAEDAQAATVNVLSENGRFSITMNWDTGAFSIRNSDTTYSSATSGISWFLDTETYDLTLRTQPINWTNETVSNSNSSSNLSAKTESIADEIRASETKDFGLGINSNVDPDDLTGLFTGYIYSRSGYETFSFYGPSAYLTAPSVPVPGALILLGSGLIGLAGLRRRQKC